MNSFFPLFMFLPVFVWIVIVSCRIVPCASCGWRMGWGAPPKKTMRQFLVGGGTCPKCGCEMDNVGNKIDPAAPKRFPVGICATFAVVVVINAVLLFYMFSVTKSVTAEATLRLHEHRPLSFDAATDS